MEKINFNSVKLIAYDFDGVMTDNTVFINQNGQEMVQVNRGDGLAIEKIKNIGIEQIIISTEKNPIVSARAKKLNIICFQGIKNKKNTLTNYCSENKIKMKNVIFLGNDINDQEVMEIVGISCCPLDANASIGISPLISPLNFKITGSIVLLCSSNNFKAWDSSLPIIAL